MFKGGPMKKISVLLLILSTLCLSSWNCQRHFVPSAPAPVATATPTPACTSGTSAFTQLFVSSSFKFGGPDAVIRSLAQWNAYWASTPNPPALPAVNFASQMILLQPVSSCGAPVINQVCYSNGGWTVSETQYSTMPYPCDPIGINSLAVILGASALPVSILFTIGNSNYYLPQPTVIIQYLTPVATPTTAVTPTPVPTVVPTPYVTVVP